MSDFLDRLDRLQAVANFHRAMSKDVDPESRKILDEFSSTLTEAYKILKDRDKELNSTSKLAESLAIEKTINRKMKMALESWDKLFPEQLETIGKTAGDKVMSAVIATRNCLGK